MDILSTALKFMFAVAMIALTLLIGVHIGRADGENRLLDKQVKSADYIVNSMQCEWAKKEVRKDIDSFTFDVCKGLGLIK